MLKNKKILVIRLTALGDTLLTLGLMKHLHKQGNTIDFITDFKWAPILAEQEYINKVFPFKKGAFEVTENEIVKKEYDIIVDLQQKPRTLKWLWKFNGKKKSTTSLMYRVSRHLLKKVSLHTVEKYVTAFTKFGVNPNFSELIPSITFSVNVKKQCEEKYGDLLKDKEKFIIVNPFASRPTKYYPWDRLESILDRLKNDGYTIVIMGIDSEIKLLEESLYMKNYRKIAESDILLYCQLVKECKLLISNDSGPKQIADAVNTKSVVFWGPTHPKTGFGVFHGHDLFSHEKCSPCSLSGEKECKFGDYRCFNSYTENNVYDFITKHCL